MCQGGRARLTLTAGTLGSNSCSGTVHSMLMPGSVDEMATVPTVPVALSRTLSRPVRPSTVDRVPTPLSASRFFVR